jgi:tetratricopeptide (TPR) repeat protein
MTNDELLSGFLDRSLSEDQLLELESRRAADPAFNHEVRSLLAVENALKVAAPLVAIPTDFLATVEDMVAAKVAAGAAPAATGMSATLKVAAAAVAALGSAVGIYLATQKVEAPAPSSAPTQAERVVAPVAIAPKASVNVKAQQPSPRVSAHSAERMADVEITANGAANAYASSSSSTTDRLVAQYEGCKRSADNMRCAQLALNIGAQYRKHGDKALATSYYTDALRIATSLHIVQYEVEALGSLGMLSIDRGNNEAAASYLRLAIERAETVDGINVEPYRRALVGLD